MVVTVICFILIYLFVGLIVGWVASEKYYVENYPLLAVLFWPLLIVVELFDEIKELLGEIFAETEERDRRK